MGQDAVRTPFTVYVQEDFDPTPVFPQHFRDALDLVKKNDSIDIIRLYAYSKYPYLSPVEKGFAEMRFSLLRPGYMKFYQYSDHPHLRRSSFFEKFGRYVEGEKVEKTEYLMMMSFLRKKGKGLQYENIHELFEQKNSSAEPSTVRRNYWRESSSSLIGGMRHLYRHLKLNFDYLFKK
jgi:hypothetical protein